MKQPFVRARFKKPKKSWGPSSDFVSFCTGAAFLVVLIFLLPSFSLLMHNYEPPAARLAPFPISVDPKNKTIVEDPSVEAMFSDSSPLAAASLLAGNAIDRIAFGIAETPAYRLAAAAAGIPDMVIIDPGFRKEEVARAFGKALSWNKKTQEAFLKEHAEEDPELPEGNFPPGIYAVLEGADAGEIQAVIAKRFEASILSRYTSAAEELVPLEEALTIASMIERETADPEEMRLISGIIWNRIFTDMRLQIDSTLQYAKANVNTKGRHDWWPNVYPRDKYIKSPYNTYMNDGLPPAPISNPSVDAVMAALNPKKTPCLYYFHDADGAFFCSETYEEHVAMLKKEYGRGK